MYATRVRLGLAALLVASVQLHVLLDLRELEEALLVQLDPLLQDAEQHLERSVLQRRLHHVQQRLVLDQPLLQVRDSIHFKTLRKSQ